MGEKVKELSVFEVHGNKVAIEYNRGWAKNSVDIHIQSDSFRYCCSNHDFMELFSLIMSAKRKFDSIKCLQEKG